MSTPRGCKSVCFLYSVLILLAVTVMANEERPDRLVVDVKKDNWDFACIIGGILGASVIPIAVAVVVIRLGHKLRQEIENSALRNAGLQVFTTCIPALTSSDPAQRELGLSVIRQLEGIDWPPNTARILSQVVRPVVLSFSTPAEKTFYGWIGNRLVCVFCPEGMVTTGLISGHWLLLSYEKPFSASFVFGNEEGTFDKEDLVILSEDYKIFAYRLAYEGDAISGDRSEVTTYALVGYKCGPGAMPRITHHDVEVWERNECRVVMDTDFDPNLAGFVANHRGHSTIAGIASAQKDMSGRLIVVPWVLIESLLAQHER